MKLVSKINHLAFDSTKKINHFHYPYLSAKLSIEKSSQMNKPQVILES